MVANAGPRGRGPYLADGMILSVVAVVPVIALCSTMTQPASSPHIVIAGASGYIGMALIPRLLERFPGGAVTAIARRDLASSDARVVWRACDLFSLKSLEEALPERVDLAFYLVHSMGPTAHLDQGDFADYDLILADNFARALRGRGVRQVIYLGGLIPECGRLSRHLQSRLEVEKTLADFALPLTVFRAGLILGEAGSSSRILLKLVQRLPFMLCPQWTQTLNTPVDLPRVLDALTDAALREEAVGRVYDLAGCPPLTYVDMMRETAAVLGKKRSFWPVPFFTPTLSRLWVSLITRSPKSLVYPLIESLEHPMVAREDHGYPGVQRAARYRDLLAGVTGPEPAEAPRPRFRAISRTVRSVQRLPLPAGRDAQWVMEQYLAWLPRFLAPLIRVRSVGTTVHFSMLAEVPVLLKLEVSESRSHRDRVLLYIVGGLLARTSEAGRLEFRTTSDRRHVLAAIHDFRPALPWYIYTISQARLHVAVMRAFSRHLARQAE